MSTSRHHEKRRKRDLYWRKQKRIGLAGSDQRKNHIKMMAARSSK